MGWVGGWRGGGLRDERPDVAATGNIQAREATGVLAVCLYHKFVCFTSLSVSQVWGRRGGGEAAACVMSTRNC